MDRIYLFGATRVRMRLLVDVLLVDTLAVHIAHAHARRLCRNSIGDRIQMGRFVSVWLRRVRCPITV